MALPIIRSNGTVSGPVVGLGRNNMVIGETIYLSDLEAANDGATHLWELEDQPIGSTTVLAGSTSPTASFIPDHVGSYRVKCSVGGIYRQVILAVPLPVTGGRIPSFLEERWYDGASNDKGWHEAMTAFMIDVDTRLGNVTPPVFGASALMSTIDIGDVAVAGVSTAAARADHQHVLPTPTVVADILGTAGVLGASTKVAREDHAHFHGNLGGGLLHAPATVSVAGFMTAADKAADFVTTTAQASLPNSRRLIQGTNVTLDATVAGQLTINAAGGVGVGTVGRVPYFGAGGVFTEGAAAPAHIHFDSTNGQLSPGGATTGYFVTDATLGTRMAWSTVMLTASATQMVATSPTWWHVWNASGVSVQHIVSNQSDTASAGARIEARVAGASAGNPEFRLAVTGLRTYEFLLNNADGDLLDLNQDSTRKFRFSGGYIYGDTASPHLRLDDAAGTFLGYTAANYVSVSATNISAVMAAGTFRVTGTSQLANFGLNTSAGVAQGMRGGIAIYPSVVPTSNPPANEIFVYNDAGLLKALQSDGVVTTIVPASGGGGFVPGGAYRVPFANAGGTALEDSAFFRFDPVANVIRGDGANAYLQLSEASGAGLFYGSLGNIIVGAAQVAIATPSVSHTYSGAGSTVSSLVHNTSNTASAAARFEVRVAGAIAANPTYRLNIDGFRVYDLLVNNADGDLLELRQDGVKKFQFSGTYIYGDSANPFLRLDNSAGAFLGYTAANYVSVSAANISAVMASGTFAITGTSQLANLGLNTSAGVAQGMRGGVAIYPSVVPTSNPPANEIFVYNDTGLLKARQSNGVITTIVPASGGGGFTPGGARRVPYANTGGTALIDNAGFTFNDTTYTIYGEGGASPYVTLNTTSGASIGYTGNSSALFAVAGATISGALVTLTTAAVNHAFAGAGSTVSHTLYNTSTAAASHALLTLKVGGTAAGNPQLEFVVPSGATWRAFLDNADSDTFKIRDPVNSETRLAIRTTATGNGTGASVILGRDTASAVGYDFEVYSRQSTGYGSIGAIATAGQAKLAAYNIEVGAALEVVHYGSASGGATYFGQSMGGFALIRAFGGNSGLALGTTAASPFLVGTNNLARLLLTSAGNVSWFSGTGSFGGGVGVIYQANATTEPTSAPSGGGLLWVSGGQWKVMGASGVPVVIS